MCVSPFILMNVHTVLRFCFRFFLSFATMKNERREEKNHVTLFCCLCCLRLYCIGFDLFARVNNNLFTFCFMRVMFVCMSVCVCDRERICKYARNYVTSCNIFPNSFTTTDSMWRHHHTRFFLSLLYVCVCIYISLVCRFSPILQRIL